MEENKRPQDPCVRSNDDVETKGPLLRYSSKLSSKVGILLVYLDNISIEYKDTF